jgi:hypothetical protein
MRLNHSKPLLTAAVFALVSLLLLPAPLLAQEALPEILNKHNATRMDTNATGMLVLGGWAAANMASGTAGWILAEDERWKSFHQMNLMWNTVNAAIAIGGYIGNTNKDPASFGLAATLDESFGMSTILALNIGLDVGYMAAGAYMWERGRRIESDRWRGWGQSVIAQGAFLFVFDIALLRINGKLNDSLLQRIEPIISPDQVGMLLHF